MFASIAVPFLLMASAASPLSLGGSAWDLREGVESETVGGFASTPSGNLWMATRGGLLRWNGVKLDRVLPGELGEKVSGVFSLAAGNGGRLWAALGAGLLACESSTAPIPCGPTETGALKILVGKSWLHDHEPRLSDFAIVSPPKALAQAAISALQETASTLWLGSERGLFRTEAPPLHKWPPALHEQTAVPVPLGAGSQTIFGIHKRKSGGILVNTASGLFQVDETYVNQLWNGPVTSVEQDEHGDVWFGTPRGVHKVGEPSFVLDMTNGLPSNLVQALALDAHAGLWVGTRNGLIRRQGEDIVTMTAALPHPDVTALHLDADNGMWVALRGGGARRAQRKLVFNFGPQEGLPPFGLNGIASDEEGEWVSDKTSLWLRGAASTQWHKRRVGPTASVFQGFVRDEQQALWLLDVGRGLWLREGTHWVLWQSPQLSLLPGPWAAAFDHQGHLWIGGSQGALLEFTRSDDANHELRLVARNQPPVDGGCLAPITSVLPLANGTTLVATNGGGMWSVQGSTLRCLGNKEGLGYRHVGAMAEEKAGTWVASPEGGLAFFNNKTFVSLSEQDGLPCDSIAALQVVGQRLWFTCAAGVGIVALSELHARMQGGRERLAHVHFNRRAGMGSDEPVFDAHPVAVTDAHGTYWTITRAGVSAIAFQEGASLPAPPRVNIEHVLIDGAVHPPGELFFRSSGLDLEVKLQTAAISGLRPTLLDKQLVGPAGTRSDYSLTEQPVFRDLLPGTYSFTARARSPHGQWGPSTQPLRIIIATPFHKQPWVSVAGAALLGALAFAFHRAKLRRLVARHQVVQNERERIARDLHDGLGQGFMALRFALETARRGLEPPLNKVGDVLDRSNDVLRQVEAEARRTIWNLRSEALGGSSLAKTLPELGKRTESNIVGGGPRVLVEINGPAHELDAMTNAELLAVAGEAVMNAVTHAHAQEIHVTLDVTSNEVRLAVYDDGHGIQAEPENAASGHFGILGMRERLRRLQGSITLDSIAGQGTAVVATVARQNKKEKT